MKIEGTLRRAGMADIPVLVEHHCRMFTEIRSLCGETPEPGSMEKMAASYRRKIERQLPVGACRAWVVEVEGRPASSGAVSFMSTVPTPEDPNSTIAYLHSIYTEPAFRGHGHARRLTEAALSECRARGVRRVQLMASDAGRHLYETLGFAPALKAMHLTLG